MIKKLFLSTLTLSVFYYINVDMKLNAFLFGSMLILLTSSIFNYIINDFFDKLKNYRRTF